MTGPDSTRVACLGECMVELRERPDGLLSRSFGGDTLNTAVYLARLGVAVDYVTALGEDAFSDEMLRAWGQEGVGTGHVVRVPGRLPGLYLIQTDAEGERRFSHWRDAAPVRDLFRTREAARVETALAGFDLVYLSGITLSLFGEADRERLFAVLDRVRAGGGRVAFDSNFRPRGWPDLRAAAACYAAMLARSDIVFVSAEDVSLLTGRPGVGEGDLRAWLGPAAAREAVLRFADLDCLVLDGGRSVPVPCRRAAAVVDTTAAGDSFAAAYLAARLSGGSAAAAAAAGHRLAALVLQHPGAIIPSGAMPDPRRLSMRAWSLIPALLVLLAGGAARADEPAMPAGMHGMHGGPADAAMMAAMDKMNADMKAPMTGDPDKDFVAMMLPHHEGAVAMAKVQLQYGKDPVLKAMARDVVASQSAEIATMKAWQAKHNR